MILDTISYLHNYNNFNINQNRVISQILFARLFKSPSVKGADVFLFIVIPKTM